MLDIELWQRAGRDARGGRHHLWCSWLRCVSMRVCGTAQTAEIKALE